MVSVPELLVIINHHSGLDLVKFRSLPQVHQWRLEVLTSFEVFHDKASIRLVEFRAAKFLLGGSLLVDLCKTVSLTHTELFGRLAIGLRVAVVGHVDSIHHKLSPSDATSTLVGSPAHLYFRHVESIVHVLVVRWSHPRIELCCSNHRFVLNLLH